ncbi:MAG: response regulator [Eubacteriales bacterium]|nr:response regulator [Eubacteriales bacterium]
MIKILIVEDEPASREGLKNLLSAHSADFNLATASNGYDGYEKALYFQPDIIITDIKMPKWDGLTMIEKLRRKNIQSEILVLTGFAEFEYAQKAIHYHVSDYILKPIMTDRVIKKIDHIVIELKKKSNVLQNTSHSKLYLMSEDDLSLFLSQIEPHNYTDFFYGIIYMGKDTHLPQEVKDFMAQQSDLYVVVLADRHYRGFILGFYNHSIRHSMISKMSTVLKKYQNLTCIYHLKIE